MKQFGRTLAWSTTRRNQSLIVPVCDFSTGGKPKGTTKEQNPARTPNNKDGEKLPGAYYNKQRQHWMSRIMVNGKLMYLGSFSTAQEAHEAYMAAKSFFDPGAAEKLVSRMKNVRKYKGVIYDTETKNFEAVLVHNDNEISGGMYDTAEKAAKAYDALARMYKGADAETNFTNDGTNPSWVPPEQEMRPVRIPVRKGEPLTVDDITKALETERGQDVQCVELGENGLGDYLICVTGRSVGHMRKIGDMLVKALQDRELEPPHEVGHWAVEGRDMDDWMVVDCGNIIVSIFDSETREAMALEDLYRENKEEFETEAGEDDYEVTERSKQASKSDDRANERRFDNWLRNNPLPEKWSRKLDKDEEEIRAARSVPSR
eukprot:gb/GECG01002183.1/.p1 GENE.gb/GECG01002183.1/~~gb/GECG01002183.1/.p1  ORF type:complete len:374 (+),score=54.62 gb/GECG01002183.1/:1-1122(+)